MTYSPLAKRFVDAPDNWDRRGADIRAIVAHMAEGGGTVTWLLRNDGNSSHYVVEYDGTIVALVDEERAAGSMNPDVTRTTDDQPFTYLGERVTYGISALKAALGTGIADPNRYAIAIEVEGFATVGPNEDQRLALARLIGDIRRRRGALPVLGHRDQQAQKACPGHRIPWVDYGGHGAKPGTTPDTVTSEAYVFTEFTRQAGTFTIPADREVAGFRIDPATGAIAERKTWPARSTPSGGDYDAIATTTIMRGNPFLRVVGGFFDGCLVSTSQVSYGATLDPALAAKVAELEKLVAEIQTDLGALMRLLEQLLSR